MPREQREAWGLCDCSRATGGTKALLLLQCPLTRGDPHCPSPGWLVTVSVSWETEILKRPLDLISSLQYLTQNQAHFRSS